jgi:aromatic ring-opening dioxygenase catalytic subunit (LigB family)
VVLDSHWATTVEFVATAQPRRAGLFTSEELPRGMCRMPYDYPGDPELAHNIAKFADKHGTWITAIDDEYLPVYYATINLWKFLGQGLPDKRWVTIGVCQTGDMEDHLRLGRALADGIAATPGRRVLLIASGALSHTFWPLRELRDHESGDPAHIFTPEARAADEERITWFKEGRHDKVLDTMDEFWKYKPEAKFFHYLMMAGASANRPASPRPASTASTRTRSAPARSTSGSTARPTAGPAREHPRPSHPTTRTDVPRKPPCPNTAASSSTAPPSRSPSTGTNSSPVTAAASRPRRHSTCPRSCPPR